MRNTSVHNPKQQAKKIIVYVLWKTERTHKNPNAISYIYYRKEDKSLICTSVSNYLC